MQRGINTILQLNQKKDQAIGHMYPLWVFAPTILSSHRSPDRVRGLTAWSPSLEVTPYYCPLIDRTGARPVPTKKDQNKRKRAIGHLYPLWVFEPTVLTNKSIKEKGYVTGTACRAATTN